MIIFIYKYIKKNIYLYIFDFRFSVWFSVFIVIPISEPITEYLVQFDFDQFGSVTNSVRFRFSIIVDITRSLNTPRNNNSRMGLPVYSQFGFWTLEIGVYYRPILAHHMFISIYII